MKVSWDYYSQLNEKKCSKPPSSVSLSVCRFPRRHSDQLFNLLNPQPSPVVGRGPTNTPAATIAVAALLVAIAIGAVATVATVPVATIAAIAAIAAMAALVVAAVGAVAVVAVACGITVDDRQVEEVMKKGSNMKLAG